MTFLRISIFTDVQDNLPKPKTLNLARLKVKEQQEKGGRLWSPAVYEGKAARANVNVAEVTALVLDIDDGSSPDEFRELWHGIACTVHSTHSHTPEHPKWRAIFPLASAVPGADWPRVWTKLTAALHPNADPSCRDASRMYFLPTCPPGAAHFIEQWEGEALNADDYPDLDASQQAPRVERSAGGRPGDEYNAATSWHDLLTRDGWTAIRTSGGRTQWRRPGKTTGCLSAVDHTGGHDGLYVFSSAADVPPGMYTKFGYVTLTRYGGDYKAAAKDLARLGFGAPKNETATRLTKEVEAIEADNPLAGGANERELILQKIELLKASDPIEYHRYAKEYAKQEGVTMKAIEDTIKLRRRGTAIQGHALSYNEPTPWPEPVDLSDVLDSLTSLFKRYISLPNYGAETLALWSALTHIYSEFRWIPKLGFVSPERECGKSLAMELLALACKRAKKTDGITPAALFRVIERDTPTIIMDEMDSYDSRGDNGEEIRKLLNASSERTGAVDRCVGDDCEVRSFSVFTPIAFAGIGDPPDTVASRSIIIRMKRKSRSDKLESTTNGRHEPAFSECHARLIRAVSDASEDITAVEFTEIPELSSRANDIWYPLLAIAKVAGGHWAETASAAARMLSGSQAKERSFKERLLFDIRFVIGDDGGHIASQDLCEKLISLQDAGWGECNRGKPITPAWLARKLRPYGIEPTKHWTGSGSGTARGYEISDFKDPFERYLPPVVEPDPFGDDV